MSKTVQPSPRQQLLWHRRLRCIYAVVPKAATTSVKHWYIATNPDCAKATVQGDVHAILNETCCMTRLPKDEAAKLLADPSVFKFSFVRNPWKRLVSGYLDKVVGAEPPAYTLVRSHTKSTFSGWLDWNSHRLMGGVEPIYQRGMSFREFVVALENEPVEAIDWHFRPQSRLLAGFPLDFLGRVENIEADFKKVMNRLNEPTPAPAEHRQQYQPSADTSWVADWPAAKFREVNGFPNWRRFYPADIAQRVAVLFADDFSQYGYSAELPGLHKAA